VVTAATQEAPLRQWASWDSDAHTLTVSRPPELTHAQLEEIWSPYLLHAVTEKAIFEINQRINHEVKVVQARGEKELQEQRQRQEAEAQRRREETTRAEEARRRAEEERRKTEEERRKAEQEAKDRAEALLLRYLSEQQKEQLRLHNYFHVVVGEDTYRIKRGFAGNVKLLDKEGREIRSFCIHPRERVPDADAMLAQKLMLETDLPQFLKTANASDIPVETRRAA
jgi:flagellar biosynthesis GTPase FlhF